VTIFRLIGLCLLHRLPSIVRFHENRDVSLDLEGAAAHEGELEHHALVQLPFNEILQLEISRWTIDVPRLSPALDGLTIAHLSDLHFTERVGKAFFREVVEVCNRLDPDLVCITGDLIDRETCLEWIPDTFGKLRSRYGIYFVLGNHDLYVNVTQLRSLLEKNGLVDLGGRWLPIKIRGTPLALGGNERPWFTSEALDAPPPPNMTRIVLAHTPDQFAWARRKDVDLVLAGHTHGGQIRIPPLGAIFTPCVAGVRYISGLYYVPPTIMHISRGLSGDIPVRWNCRPEISLLTLRSLLPQRNESRITGRTL
jgi:predicted MPP superfamily phosphohydrolase